MKTDLVKNPRFSLDTPQIRHLRKEVYKSHHIVAEFVVYSSSTFVHVFNAQVTEVQPVILNYLKTENNVTFISLHLNGFTITFFEFSCHHRNLIPKMLTNWREFVRAVFKVDCIKEKRCSSTAMFFVYFFAGRNKTFKPES